MFITSVIFLNNLENSKVPHDLDLNQTMSNAKLVQAVFQYYMYIKPLDLYHLFCGTHTPAHTHIHTNTHQDTHTYTQTQTKTHTKTNTHTHTNTHTQTCTHVLHVHTLSTLSKYISELKQK